MDEPTVVSAPGKVLITGGYLILEQPNSGLVLSTSARFFAIVKPVCTTPQSDSWAWSWTDVKVSSPQLFKETTYKLSLRDFSLKQVSPPPGEGGNPFVENAIEMAVAAAKAANAGDSDGDKLFSAMLLQGLSITILGNNAFYSFRKTIEAKSLPVTAKTLASLPEFSAITLNPSEAPSQEKNGRVLPEVAKTGLGSSAAMTSAVVGGILDYLGSVKLPVHSDGEVNDMDAAWNLDLVHSIAQAAHCAAQGKVGSGFDVSSAVYGSQRYIRFSPSVLSTKESSNINSPLSTVQALLQRKWDGERTAYALPPQLLLIIGEPGYGGSHTPSMVGAVMTWRKKDPEQDKVWSAIAKANKGVEAGLSHLNYLAQNHEEAYHAAVNLCSTSRAQEWEKVWESYPEGNEIVAALVETRNAFTKVRSGLQLLGEKAGVPIEPPIQTELLDETMKITGVLLAGVPGAGGYDAVFAITLGQVARDQVELEWNRKGVLTLPTKEDPCGVALEKVDPRLGHVGSDLESLSII
ncbi:unnamed protein product [Calypogeia fissa]